MAGNKHRLNHLLPIPAEANVIGSTVMRNSTSTDASDFLPGFFQPFSRLWRPQFIAGRRTMPYGGGNLTCTEKLLIQIADLRVMLDDVLSQDLAHSQRLLLLDYVANRLDQLIALLKKVQQKAEPG